MEKLFDIVAVNRVTNERTITCHGLPSKIAQDIISECNNKNKVFQFFVVESGVDVNSLPDVKI